MNLSRIPLCLVVGFLGSGKTTLLRNIIHQHGDKRLAFVVNEFSSLDADGAMLRREHDAVVCLPGGSVFCRCLSGQFIQTLKELPQQLHLSSLDGVVVEASGIADPGVAPQMLIEAGLDCVYDLACVVAVTDPGNIEELLKTLPNSKAQIQSADIILINKTDMYDDITFKRAETVIRDINSHATLERTEYCRTSLSWFGQHSEVKTSGQYALCADPNFALSNIEINRTVDPFRVLRALNTLSRELYRAKGFLKTATGAVYLDWTPTGCSQFDLPDHDGPFGFSLIGAGDKAAVIKALAARMQSGVFDAKT